MTSRVGATDDCLTLSMLDVDEDVAVFRERIKHVIVAFVLSLLCSMNVTLLMTSYTEWAKKLNPYFHILTLS